MPELFSSDFLTKLFSSVWFLGHLCSSEVRPLLFTDVQFRRLWGKTFSFSLFQWSFVQLEVFLGCLAIRGRHPILCFSLLKDPLMFASRIAGISLKSLTVKYSYWLHHNPRASWVHPLTSQVERDVLFAKFCFLCFPNTHLPVAARNLLEPPGSSGLPKWGLSEGSLKHLMMDSGVLICCSVTSKFSWIFSCLPDLILLTVISYCELKKCGPKTNFLPSNVSFCFVGLNHSLFQSARTLLLRGNHGCWVLGHDQRIAGIFLDWL